MAMILPADVNIHQHAGYFHRLRAHCLLCALNVDRVIGDKPVDHVKLVPAFAVQLDDQTVVHFTEETGSKGLSMAISPLQATRQSARPD